MLENLSFLTSELSQAPTYALGDQVLVQSTVDGNQITDFGWIAGIEYEPEFSYIPGYWYSVQFTLGPNAGARDWVSEDEIVKRLARKNETRVIRRLP